ncbi:hypothetical protein [Paenibacillus sp. HB172176]|uniref:hypothetical protein n=1 Tax=Paenibacillus sp. HB172176 TaxID=2493690 RepID=UPI0014396756|nr:hypothetical protein [Paenibacillus sp. HB172176]
MISKSILLLSAICSCFVIWKRNHAKGRVVEAVCGILIIGAGTGLDLAIMMHLPISPPTDWITFMFAPFYQPIVNWIKGG